MGLDPRRFRLNGNLSVGLERYHSFRKESSVKPGYGVSMQFDLARRIALTMGHDRLSTRDRYSSDLDARVRRDEQQTSVGVSLGPWGRVSFSLSGSTWERQIPKDETFGGQALRPTLEERIRSATAAVKLELTPRSSLAFSFTPSTHRFHLFPARDADASEFRIATTFAAGALVEGTAHVGFLHYFALAPTVQDYVGPVMAGELWHIWRERTEVGVRGGRSVGTSYDETSSYVVVTSYGGWVRQALSRRFDVVLQVDQGRYNYRGFDVPGPDQLPPKVVKSIRYATQFGVLFGGMRVGLEAIYNERLGGSSL